MSKVITLLASKRAFKSKASATPEEIRKAEDLLGLNFAKEYTEYLEQYGQVIYYGHEFTGLTETKRLNVVDVTNEERKNNPDIPNSMYVIEQTHMDDIVIWQTDTGEIFQSQPGSKLIKLFESLSEYIEFD